MENYLDKILSIFTSAYFKWFRDILDIALVSYFIYRALLLIKGTRAVQLIKGLLILFVVYYIVNNYLQLRTMAWIMQNAATLIIVAIPIVFQPELRRLLAHIGKDRLIIEPFFTKGKDLFDFINIMVLSVKNLSNKKSGALIIIERNTGLNEFIETGVKLDAIVTPDIIESIFYSGTPLHDGAVVIKNNRIVAASVLLPLSENLKPVMGRHNLGTRHRAGLGLSETSDAICIVVSEETGDISVAINGKLYRHLTDESFEKLLLDNYQSTPQSSFRITKIFSKKEQQDALKHAEVIDTKKEEGSDKETKKNRKPFQITNLNLIMTSIVSALIFMLLLGKTLPSGLQRRTFVLPVEVKYDSNMIEEAKSVKVQPTHVRVRLQGSNEELDELKVDNIDIFVNLDDVENNSRMPVNVTVPTDVALIEVIPKHVTVNIE